MAKASHKSTKKAVAFSTSLCLAFLGYLYLFDITSVSKIYYFADLKTIQENEEYNPDPGKPIVCDRNHFYYDICYLNGPTILDPKTATFFTTGVSNSTQEITEKIHPHPRILNTPLYLVRELTLTTARSNTTCTITHHSPALIISAGGWTGNFFHDITDRFIPLFITVEAFFPDRDFVLGIFNYSDLWVKRYTHLLSAYTHRHIINLDKKTAVHCFPSVTVGLISHGPTAVDPTLQQHVPHPKTIRDFSKFFKSAYAHNETSSKALPWKSEDRPRLVIVNRDGPRSIVNVNQVQKAAERLGFEVIIFMPSHRTTLHEAYRLVDSSHALIGVHGAALSNILFLRPGSVFIQIVPPKCDWLADLCFGKMAIRLGLEYMIYDAGEDESILELSQETRDWAAQRDTQIEIWAVYRDQKLRLDKIRFKRYLKRAYNKAVLFMRKQNSKAGKTRV